MAHGKQHVDVTFKLRRKTASEWWTDNTFLEEGEPAHEKDTGRIKVGDGINRWRTLSYSVPTELLEKLVANAVAVAINLPPIDESQTPDSSEPTNPPVLEDDGTSFLLLYENAKV